MPAPVPTPAPVPAPVGPFEWKVDTIDAAGHAVFEDFWYPWAKEIEEKTGGMVKPTIYPVGALGYGGSQQLVLLQAGIHDVAQVITGWNTGHFPDLAFMDLPALFRSGEEVHDGWKATQYVWERELFSRFGVHPIMYTSNDEQIPLSSKKLTCLDDLKGQKVRVFSS
ncbi:unnamed protein product, partial [marine sediment metagenome]